MYFIFIKKLKNKITVKKKIKLQLCNNFTLIWLVTRLMPQDLLFTSIITSVMV